MGPRRQKGGRQTHQLAADQASRPSRRRRPWRQAAEGPQVDRLWPHPQRDRARDRQGADALHEREEQRDRRRCLEQQGQRQEKQAQEGRERVAEEGRAHARVHRASALQAGRARPRGRGLGARGEVRWVSPAAPGRGWRGCPAHAQGTGLDAQVLCHRGGRGSTARLHHRRRGLRARSSRGARFHGSSGGTLGRRLEGPHLLRVRLAVRRGARPARAAPVGAQGRVAHPARLDQGEEADDPLRRPLRDRRRCRAPVRLQDAPRRHRVEGARCALQVRPPRHLGEGEVPRGPRGRDRRLDQRRQEAAFAAGRRASWRQAGLCRPRRHRLQRKGNARRAAETEGG